MSGMILKQLTLRRYRNLVDVKVTWNAHFNVLYGRNAQGKTNLLEAISLLGHLKSFRGARGQELISHNEEDARIEAQVIRNNVTHSLEIGLQKNGRNPSVNGKTVEKLSDFLGYLRTVIFAPEELARVKGYPAGRRALLDRAILQADGTYLDRVQQYERILRQRNRLLKEQADDRQLEPWTAALIKSGSRIRHDRLLYLQRFEPYLQQAFAEISTGQESVTLHYSVPAEGLTELNDLFVESLKRVAEREKRLGVTLSGPHRDDLEILIDGKSLRTFGSQGQQRSFLLAFKAAQVLDLENALQDTPILLLDDLASELDSHRQEGFFKFLMQRSGQVFLTSAQQSLLTAAVRQKASYYQVHQGLVTAISPERG
ncbi:MAG: DNA replication/repair protein RecF [Desulfuromonadales bacterium]